MHQLIYDSTVINKHSVKYAEVPSAIKAAALGPGIPVSEPPSDFAEFDSLSSTDTEDESNHDLWAQQRCGASNRKQPKLFTQAELNDLTRDLNLLKNKLNSSDLDFESTAMY